MNHEFKRLAGALAASFCILGTAACAVEGTDASDQARGGALQSVAVASSDAEIAAIVSLSNRAEITQSELALTRARVPSVLDFAQRMIAAHTQAELRQSALLRRLGITPQQSTLSASLSTEATSLTSSLESQPADAFDRAYMESQIQLHQRTLQLLDTQLVPLAVQPELRSELERARPEIAQHLAMAEQILTTLGV